MENQFLIERDKMHRKIISSIVFVSFLNLLGCYSPKVITYKEYSSLNNPMDAIVVAEEEEKIVLTSDSLKNTYMQWDSGRDTLAIYSTHLSKVWQGASKVVTDTVYFTKNEIVDVYIDDFDATKTVLVIAIPVILIAAFIIGYSNSSIIELDSWR